jgi:hypothetical protein
MDADEQLGQPIVSNGLPLTKLHHAAFDAQLIGIDPDYRTHVSVRVVQESRIVSTAPSTDAGHFLIDASPPREVDSSLKIRRGLPVKATSSKIIHFLDVNPPIVLKNITVHFPRYYEISLSS